MTYSANATTTYQLSTSPLGTVGLRYNLVNVMTQGRGLGTYSVV